MAQLLETFSVDSLPTPTTGNFEPLPAGWYTAVVNGAEIKNTKAGTGQYIAVRYDITGPTHQGRVVFGNLNIVLPFPIQVLLIAMKCTLSRFWGMPCSSVFIKHREIAYPP